jgi:RND family efflux transporter MFP subunit
VKTTTGALQSFQQPRAYSGTAEPIEKVRVSTKIMGWIEEIYFDEGAKVNTGANLVKLRSTDLEAKRAQADAAISEAQAHFKNVETNLQRIESLYEKKAATQKELDDMRTAFASAKARYDTALEMKKEVEEMLAYTALKAPFDGSVTRKMMDVGDLVNPGQPILEVENIAKVKVVTKVPENDVRNLHVSMPVQVQIPAARIGANGKSAIYNIDKIVPSADPISRQFDIHVIMDNTEGQIKPGMFARMVIARNRGSALLVPQKAVFRRGQLEGVFVIDSQNRARLRWIRTGVTYGDQVEVLSGLNVDEQVVLEGAITLSDGQLVEVR